MGIKELKKKQALCGAINMKFNEANELFEAETLQSMQMAQICGGTTIAPVAAWKYIKEGAYVLSTIMEMYNTVEEFGKAWKERLGGTPPPAGATIRIDVTNNSFSFEVGGSVKIDSIITPEIKIYGVDTTPTPIGNSNSSGSTDMP